MSVKWINTYVNESITVLFSLLKEVNEKQHREKWRMDYVKINQEQTDKCSLVSIIRSI